MTPLLFSLDLYAWMILAYHTGDLALPSKDEMIKNNQEFLEKEMHIHDSRYILDEAYCRSVRPVAFNPTHWENDQNDERFYSFQSDRVY